jgi:hypothetical protein
MGPDIPARGPDNLPPFDDLRILLRTWDGVIQ